MGVEGIAPRILNHGVKMEVKGKLHAPFAALLPTKKTTQPIE